MNISLPDQLKAFVDEQVSQRGYGTSSEYVRELIRKDQERVALRELLLAGGALGGLLAAKHVLELLVDLREEPVHPLPSRGSTAMPSG